MDCASFLYAEPWFHFTPDNLNCFTLVLIWTNFMVFWFDCYCHPLLSAAVYCDLVWSSEFILLTIKIKPFKTTFMALRWIWMIITKRWTWIKVKSTALSFWTIRWIWIRFYVCQPNDPHKAFNRMPGSTGFKVNCSPKKADLPVIRLDVMVTLILKCLFSMIANDTDIFRSYGVILQCQP